MWKSLISLMFVIAVFIVSVIPVGAVDVPTASTEYTSINLTIPNIPTDNSASLNSTAPTDVSTENNTEIETITKDSSAVLIFVISVILGVLLGQAFSFWKW